MQQMTDIDSRLPRYQRLRDEIARDIAQQNMRPGDAIPTEAALAARHGVAVGTVRKAIDALVADGLVERQQGRGTFVRRPNFDQSLFRFLRQHAGGGQIPESRILQRETAIAPAEVAAALRLPPKGEGIHLQRLRLLDGTPMLAETIWLPKAMFAPLLALPLAEIGPLLYPFYERVCGQTVASARETLSVETASPIIAGRLALAAGSPVVVVERLATGFDGQPLEWRRSHIPAAQFRYHIEIK